ncbi:MULTISPECIES: SAV_6107 family HEPN domain-containing protein [Pseudonocardia]|uniref:SAV-6107-like HEPN domain-containing protein n=2 Tax=Pseudonocardia TaxID=1847 RepID=A0A1Y2MQ73_PSEAH|nr:MULTISPECIES: SAV_6107 family HEPN domain-containing protein [Pseudonocardia]OSY37311.1 hypothetical protein BG845_04822 [Pseudonocardia autotrophica]TDN72392.1 hypothetical protein C8E95_1449 [Pseudonocardia autotrophica]BBG03100.1 hypothetical protein Pdca_43090 [Pseudonocardia autotrophica]GEC23720.1 hypothetical protein PSA01_07490 [Pseudonocardia saturnea]
MSTTMELDLWLPAARDGRDPEPEARAEHPAGSPPVPASRVCRTGGRDAGACVPRGGVPRARVSGGRGAAAAGGAGAPPSRDALALLRQAAEQLAEAHREPDPMRRYPAAYLAALRAGAAVLAMRARPRPRRGAPRDVWRLLAEVAPELEEWASYFASCSRVRAAAEAGIERLVDRRGADDLLRQAEQFVERVQLLLPR